MFTRYGTTEQLCIHPKPGLLPSALRCQEYIYEDGPFSVRPFFLRLTMTANYIARWNSNKRRQENNSSEKQLSFSCFSLQMSLKLNPKSDSHGYVLLLQTSKKLNRTRKQIQTERSARNK